MSSPSRITIIAKSIQQLGLKPVLYMALHRFGYFTGHYYRLTRNAPFLTSVQLEKVHIISPLNIPATEYLRNDEGCLPAAEEIVEGKYRPFSGDTADLSFSIPDAEVHWTKIGDSDPQNDLKLTWEPARFCWVSPLIRAFTASGDPRYVRSFWDNWHAFQELNKPCLGPNWVSAQEVAIRLINWSIALQIFGSHPETRQDEREALIQAIYQHAHRIPCSIAYAQAQNNNHLLTEAAGLFTAGCLFKHIPAGQKWMQLGWQLFNQGITSQIDTDGTYIQHSMNYHRLMLQTAFWMAAAARTQNMDFPENVRSKLTAATCWLLAHLDPVSGKAANLGHNDGTYLFPLSGSGYADYRPTAQTAACLFLGQKVLPDGSWDEMTAWFSQMQFEQEPSRSIQGEKLEILRSPHVWASMHTAQFSNRPAHADQLHVEQWWDGENIIQDAGTYRYTAPPPWDNRLSRSAYHNTLTIDGIEPMLHAGRFLWLDWDQVRPDNMSGGDQEAFHTGYERHGFQCKRKVSMTSPNLVEVMDSVKPVKDDHSLHLLSLHWLLPDWDWKMEEPNLLALSKPGSSKVLRIEHNLSPANLLQNQEIQIVRAGQVLLGQEDALTPTLGWTSPTYNKLIPAISFRITFKPETPVTITSKFTFSQA